MGDWVEFTIIRADGTEERGALKDPTKYEHLSACIKKAIGVDEIERVRGMIDGKMVEFFCDEMGHMRKQVQRQNNRATFAYRALAMKNGYDTDHWIPGDVILFDRPVWDNVE